MLCTEYRKWVCTSYSHNQFGYLPIDGHLGWCHCFTVVHKVVMKRLQHGLEANSLGQSEETQTGSLPRKGPDHLLLASLVHFPLILCLPGLFLLTVSLHSEFLVWPERKGQTVTACKPRY
jgi:hypothetical protein